MCGGRAPSWGPSLPAQVLSVFWALTPGLSWPAPSQPVITAGSAPPGGQRGPLLISHLLVSGPQQKLRFQLDAGTCGPGAGGRGPPIPGAGQEVVTSEASSSCRSDGRMVRVLLLLVCTVGSSPGKKSNSRPFWRRQEGSYDPGGRASCWVASVPGRPALGSY